MLGYLTLILLCQLIGEIVARLAKLPIGGPVIGMVLLFCWLLFRKGMPSELESVGGFLLRSLPLLFVPAGVGVIVHIDFLMKFWAPFAGAIIIGTVITVAVTGAVMQLLNQTPVTDQETHKP